MLLESMPPQQHHKRALYVRLGVLPLVVQRRAIIVLLEHIAHMEKQHAPGVPLENMP